MAYLPHQEREVAVTLDRKQWHRVHDAILNFVRNDPAGPDAYQNALLREYAGEIENACDAYWS